MVKINRLLLSFLLIALGCDFVPNEEDFTVVNQPDISDVSLTLNAATDTISLYQTKESKCSLNGVGILESITFVLIDSDSILVSDSRNSFFTINVNQLGTGSHKLHITSIFSKRTNSLAGKLGLELFSISREWPIIIDIDPPTPVQIISVENSGGKLNLIWNKYQRVNFQNYYLTKRCYDSPQSTSFTGCKNLIFSDKNITQYLDTEYTTGKVEYIISVQASNQIVSSSPYVYID